MKDVPAEIDDLWQEICYSTNMKRFTDAFEICGI